MLWIEPLPDTLSTQSTDLSTIDKERSIVDNHIDIVYLFNTG